MSEKLSAEELKKLVRNVFEPRPEDKAMVIIVDLPDERKPDREVWRLRRQMACDWAHILDDAKEEIGLSEVLLCIYPNVGANNAELPDQVALVPPMDIPDDASGLDESLFVPLRELYDRCSIGFALTELSATAPLKLAARKEAIRAVTMPGFTPDMVPSLRLDYPTIDRQLVHLKTLLDRSKGARIEFLVRGEQKHDLYLDLRHRAAHVSGGRKADVGEVGNLPPGETYIVPYEGEVQDQPTRSEGELPVQFGDELVLYRITANRAVEVLTKGKRSDEEREHLERDPAYGNMAELGFGVLAQFGIEPCGEVLLDEKLGLHIAFGRSDHFGGQVGPSDFSAPGAVVHIDRVYLPQVQPQVVPTKLVLEFDDEDDLTLMIDGQYAIALGE